MTERSSKVRALKLDRANARRKLTNYETFLASFDPETEYPALEKRFKQLDELYVNFNESQTELELLEEGNLDEDGCDIQARNDFENKYYNIYNKSSDLLSKSTRGSTTILLPSTSNQSNTSETTRQVLNVDVPMSIDSSDNFKVPSLSLPTFNGSYETWLGFHDVFSSMIDNNLKLSPILKLRHLRDCLKGEAAEIIASIQLSAENYSVAWELVKETYDKRGLIRENHIQDLIAIPCMSKEFSVRALLLNVQKHVRALKILDEPVEQWGSLLVVLIKNKMDVPTLDKWDEIFCDSDRPTFDEMISFLTRRAQKEDSRSGQGRSKAHDTVEKKTASNSRSRMRPQHAFIAASKKNICPHCKADHDIFACEAFLNLSSSERFKVCKGLFLCLNCLQSNHRTSKCNRGPCKKCQKKHNTLLHFETQAKEDSDGSTSSPPETAHNFFTNNIHSEAMLSTALVDIINNKGKVKQCRLLIDNGSQPHCLTDQVVSFLELPRESVDISVLSLSTATTAVRQTVKATLKSRYNNQFQRDLNFLIVDTLDLKHTLPSFQINRESLEIPKNIFLADPDSDKPDNIDGILGMGIFYDLLCIGQMRLKNHPGVLQKTHLGWIIAGELYGVPLSNHKTLQCNFTCKQPSIDLELAKFWELEEVSSLKALSPEDIACEEHFMKNTTRNSEGRYVVKLPFNEEIMKIGHSRSSALRQFYSLENRFRKQPELKIPYDEFLAEYEQLNHMYQLAESDASFQGFYMPHHPVVKQDRLTTKVRVVFNGSAKSSTGVSLNDTLLVGPTIQDDLFTQLIRFRSKRYALTADMEKMYRQVLVHLDDQIYQKIVYRKNPNETVKTYCLKTLTYGTACASFLAIRTLHQLADDEGASHPLAATVLKRDCYVDDLLTGTNKREEALVLRNDLIALLRKGGFNLRKWASNDPSLVSDLNDNREDSLMALDPSTSTKTLGVHWNSSEDSIFYVVNLPETSRKISKRLILSQVAKLFDPLGLLGPIIVFAKIIMQLLWKANVNWDESIPIDIHTSWLEYISQLSLLKDLRFNRCLLTSNPTEIQLHGFCDASERAYGACIYLRSTDHEGLHLSHLVCSKSRVAPIKSVSLPRLELCAALLLANLWTAVRRALDIQINKIVFWSDSTIALHWIHTSPHLLKTFISNRVSKIQALTQSVVWRHVPSQDNPADLVSRGQLPQEFLNATLWSHGPDWLVQAEEAWPQIILQIKEIPEMKVLQTSTISMNITIAKFDILEKYSSLRTLKRVIAYCLRFIHNCKYDGKRTGDLTISELDVSMNQIIKFTQARDFSREIKRLSRGENIDSKSKLLTLNPYLDEGIIRVGGRLIHSALSTNQRHPIVLPKNHHVTTLIIRGEHIRLKHAGIQTTLYAVRELFWPIDGRSTTRHVIHQCIPCFRAKPRGVNYVMGNLPAKRLSFTRAFINTGIDYCGPFYIKEKKFRNRGKVKCYVAIFVCLATKALHLELVSDLTSEAFLAALKRFFSRRGKSSSLMSDNATNFVGANRELEELQALLLSEVHNEEVKRFLSDQRVQWSFIPPRAPHFGGLWEAGVKSFKHLFLRTVGDALLTFEQLQTYVIEIEAILNSRPITPLSSDPNDYRSLTPGHFLIGESLVSFPQADLSHLSCNRLSAWQHVQMLRQHFWNRWHREYLNELNVRSKWKSGSSDDIILGTMVVLKEDNTPPLNWVLGRVIAIHPGQDNVVRVVTVKTEIGTYKRSVRKLCPLPVDTSDAAKDN